MSADDLELLKEFAVESQEHLADIENQLLTLESQGDEIDIALVNTVFRAIHSIKGAAGFMGLDTLGGLAHRAEEVLGKLRSKDLRPTSIVINTLLKATDRLKELIDDVENSNGQYIDEHVEALEDILQGRIDIDAPRSKHQQVDLTASDRSSGGAADVVNENIEDPSPTLVKSLEESSATSNSSQDGSDSLDSPTDSLDHFLSEALGNLEKISKCIKNLDRNAESQDSLDCLRSNIDAIKKSSDQFGCAGLSLISGAMADLIAGIQSGSFGFDAQISEAFVGAAEVMQKLLLSEEDGNESASIDYQFTVEFLGVIHSMKAAGPQPPPSQPLLNPQSPNTPSPASDVESSILSKSVITKPAKEKVSGSKARNGKSPFASKTENPVTKEQKTEKSHTVRQAATPETVVVDSTIRVDVALLDRLMTRVGELVLARNQILQFNSTIEDAGLQNAVQRLNLITSELQEGVMKTRMQPIGNVWSKFPRLVRDLASMCEKQVRIEMEGKETELDKTIIEAIKDPLTHLVRNTVDHGIEKPELRQQLGKPIEGCLTLKAYHEGGQVNIEIVDDGGGLNFERIKGKAIEKGLVSADEAARMLDRDVGNLIFLPGFSTAEQVSSVSGRGVGMDVVRTNIEKIGGTVDLQSQPGKGTTIKIKIPLTLAIVPALIVTADGDRYAIPQVNLLELVRLENQIAKPSVERIQGAPVYRLRGQLLPLVSLREQLGIPGSGFDDTEDCLNIVVLKADDRHFGLIVDRICDSEEIVVKPLGKQIKNVPIYSGTTIMGDGCVALILDVIGLAQSAKVITGNKGRSAADTADSSAFRRSQRQTLLILSAGNDRRFALPLSQVTRLEKVAASSIEQSRNREVVQYRGEIMPLIRLSDAASVSSTAYDSEELDVVVYTKNQRSIGLVVDRILDIAEVDLYTGTHSLSEDGDSHSQQNSIVIQNHVTDLLDLPTLVGAM